MKIGTINGLKRELSGGRTKGISRENIELIDVPRRSFHYSKKQ